MFSNIDDDPEPAVVGRVVAAEIGGDDLPDVLRVKADRIASDTGHLLRDPAAAVSPGAESPFFVLFGQAGTIARHGFTETQRVIGRRCVIYADDRFDQVSFEADDGAPGPVVTWTEYT
jgi:hypothetical protein